ncbi:MAG TPA: hypothetical protein VHD37_02075 [Candidatus Paceibacterota bacterium]|nr:hypothetical protein [Candidatus Paceibacterota bacterium]
MKLTTYSLLVLGLLSLAGTASAHTGENMHFKADFKGGMSGMHRPMFDGKLGDKKDAYALVPADIRADIQAQAKDDFKNMTKEERKSWMEDMKAQWQKWRTDWENFVGLSSKEIRAELKDGKTMGDVLEDQGKSEAQTKVFLTDKANDRVDALADRYDLSSSQEATLRDRIANFVQHILDRWFK